MSQISRPATIASRRVTKALLATASCLALISALPPAAAAAMLILFAPGTPRERFFSELADIEATGRELTSDEWRDFYLRHDQVNV